MVASRSKQRNQRLMVDGQQENEVSKHELMSSCPHVSKRNRMRSRSCFKGAADNRTEKSVRFATRKSTKRGNVHCSVKIFEKEDQALLDSLFWTRDELYETYDDERPKVEEVEPLYCKALRMAYDQSSEATTSDVEIFVDFEDMALCSQARGLEREIFPVVRQITRKHRRAVLLVQDKLRDADADMEDDRYLELLRNASQKYSRPSRLVAMRMGEFDSVDSSDEENAYDPSDSSAISENDPIDIHESREQSFYG